MSVYLKLFICEGFFAYFSLPVLGTYLLWPIDELQSDLKNMI